MTSVQPEPPGTWVTCFVSELKPTHAGDGSPASVCWASLSGRPAWEIHINIDCLLSHLGRGWRVGPGGGAPSDSPGGQSARAEGWPRPSSLLPVGGAELIGWRTPCTVAHTELRSVLTSGDGGACQQGEHGGLWGHS